MIPHAVRLPTSIATGILALAAGLTAQTRSPAPIVNGVRQIWNSFASTAVTGLGTHPAEAIVSGDEDSSRPSVFVVIGSRNTANSGHVLATTENLPVDASNSEAGFDTLKFNVQALQWLDRNDKKTIGILGGHSTFVGRSRMGVLIKAMTDAGYTVSTVPSITAANLAGIGVLFIGNSWGEFPAAELSTLEGFVGAGNGMYLVGRADTWGRNRGQYPMNALGERFGVQFLRATVRDQTNLHKGQTVFRTFYPNAAIHMPITAVEWIQKLADDNPTNLRAVLRQNATTRGLLWIATRVVSHAFDSFRDTAAANAILDTRVRALLNKHTSYFGMATQYDRTQDAALAVCRAVLHGGVVAAFPLDAARLALVEPALGIRDSRIPAEYRTLLRDHSFILLDNRTLNGTERTAILSLMQGVRGIARDLDRMTVRETWSTVEAEYATQIPGRGVNVFRGDNMQRKEQQFPSDFAPRSAPLFMTAVAHEIGHILDSANSRNSEAFRNKKAQLLRDAGLDNLQFLRGNAQFFQNAPQEFVASMANQWNIDTIHTLRLALKRFRDGKEQPLQQAFFMLELYKVDQSTGRFHDMDLGDGSVRTWNNTITRDSQGRVTAIYDAETSFRFAYDATGKVIEATEGWTRFGTGTRGTAGVPFLEGEGLPLERRNNVLRVERAAANAPVIVVIGTARINVPLFGGTLYPNPLVTLSLTSDGLGESALPLSWPSNTSGFRLHFQAFVFDRTATQNFASTNGATGVTL